MLYPRAAAGGGAARRPAMAARAAAPRRFFTADRITALRTANRNSAARERVRVREQVQTPGETVQTLPAEVRVRPVAQVPVPKEPVRGRVRGQELLRQAVRPAWIQGRWIPLRAGWSPVRSPAPRRSAPSRHRSDLRPAGPGRSRPC